MRSEVRVVARRVVFVTVVAAQLFFLARAYWAPHMEFGFHMFPESSTWQASVVRVTSDGRRIPVEQPWSGYRWDQLTRGSGVSYPSVRRHANAGLDNQLAFLRSALNWVASNTPRDRETRYLEARVIAWRNDDPPYVETFRSHAR